MAPPIRCCALPSRPSNWLSLSRHFWRWWEGIGEHGGSRACAIASRCGWQDWQDWVLYVTTMQSSSAGRLVRGTRVVMIVWPQVLQLVRQVWQVRRAVEGRPTWMASQITPLSINYLAIPLSANFQCPAGCSMATSRTVPNLPACSPLVRLTWHSVSRSLDGILAHSHWILVLKPKGTVEIRESDVRCG